MPFLDENDDDYYSPESRRNCCEGKTFSILSGDRRFYLIGGAASIVAFISIMAFMYANSKPVDLGELPVIQADTSPIKAKPEHNEQVAHQDKLVYDNISGNNRVLKERIVPTMEEPIQDLQSFQEDVLSEEERNNIIREFDELAPRSSTAYIPPHPQTLHQAKITPPIRPGIRKNNLKQVVSQNLKKRPIVNTSSKQGAIMMQVASVNSRTAAEAEYNRIVRKNGFLRRFGKKIVKVDLGAKGIKYRVQIGPLRTRSEAQNYISQLRNAGTMAYISK